MPRMFSLSALNERLAIAIAVGDSAQDLAAPRLDFGVELLGRHDLVDEPHRERLGRRVAPAQEPDLARPLLADEPRQIGGAPARIDRADLGADLAELRLLRRDRQVAHGRQHIAAADRIALHRGDDRLAGVADRAVQFLDRQPDEAAPAIAARSMPRAELSPPAQKARSPAPASTMTPMSGPLGVAHRLRASPRRSAARNAFSTSGRLIVIVAMPSRFS